MFSVSAVLAFAHLIGLALGLGCATAKATLLFRSRTDPSYRPTFLAVARPITRLIILGLVLLTLSGIGWLLLGYPLTPKLVAKLVLVGAIWVVGPIIDNAVEPEFRESAPGPGEEASAAFRRIELRYLRLEAFATGLFYLIVAIWVLA